MAWKELLTFEDEPVLHTVCGKPLNFFPVTLRTLFALKDVAKPLSKAVAVLFSDHKNDYGTTEREFGGDPGGREIIINPIAVEVIKLRETQQAQAIENLIEALTADKTQNTIGTLIMDSLREVFPPGDKANPPVSEFMGTLGAAQIYPMLVGVSKANKGLFGPLADRLSEMGKRVGASVESKLGAKGGSTTPSPSPSNPSPTPSTKPVGETSKTTSSGSPSEATT